jgi:hypothetical protein
LVHDAADYDAAALRMLGRRVFEVVDPDAAEAEEGRRLEREERTAARALSPAIQPPSWSGLGTAHLDAGVPVSAGEARRLACSSGIIPVVYRRALDGRSMVLDVGRRRRLRSEAQRIALAVRDRGCTSVGCDRPAAWCHAHHDVPWSQGGGTSVARGRLLCGFHHRKAHSPSHDLTHRHAG